MADQLSFASLDYAAKKKRDQQAALLLHRTWDILIRQRSSLISAITAPFAQFGIVAVKGDCNVEKMLKRLHDAPTS